MKKRLTGRKRVSLFTRTIFFLHFTNSFQCLSNWKMEIALALYFGSSVLATEQFSIIRDKRHRIVHSDFFFKYMIAGLPVCHLSGKSSPSNPSCVLSDLIMPRIKSRERERTKREATVFLFVPVEDKRCSAQPAA